MSDLVGKPEDRFSPDAAHIKVILRSISASLRSTIGFCEETCKIIVLISFGVNGHLTNYFAIPLFFFSPG